MVVKVTEGMAYPFVNQLFFFYFFFYFDFFISVAGVLFCRVTFSPCLHASHHY